MDLNSLKLCATTIVRPADVVWTTPEGAPENSYESFFLSGGPRTQGPYLALMRWHPGYMSAPHTYHTARLAYVLSGTWWVGDGPLISLQDCLALGAGSFVHRPTGAPHYDGVISGATEPAVIAVSGIAPIGLRFMNPDEPGLRRV